MPTSPFPNCAVSSPPAPLPLWEAVVVVVSLSLPQAARNAADAADPPVRAMNFRRETGSLASRATAFSDISLLLGWFAHLTHLRPPSLDGSSDRVTDPVRPA